MEDIIVQHSGKNITLFIKEDGRIKIARLRYEDGKLEVATHPYVVTDKIIRSAMAKGTDQKTSEAIRRLRGE